jgi:ceramide glucosyltransferase
LAWQQIIPPRKNIKPAICSSRPFRCRFYAKWRWRYYRNFCFLCAVLILNFILAALAILSCALQIWQWLAARNFPLHRKIAVPGFAPAVSILKPLKGVEAADHSAAEMARRLIAENPDTCARLIACENLVGANAKAAKLAQLEKIAAHDLILVSDADVRVPPDFLASLVAPLRDEKTTLVSCFYRLANPVTAAMRWEAVAINADFWSQVLQAKSLKPLDFALGAAMLVRRRSLAEIGSFGAFADHLADDYQLGNRLAKKGHRLALCPVVVECWHAPQGWKQVWKHQLRWARTIRVCQPAPYFFSVLSNVTLWAMLWFFSGLPKLSAAVTQHGDMHNIGFSFVFPWGAMIAPVLCLLRICIAQNLQRRLTPDRKLVSPFWLMPVRDLLNAAVWLAAFLGNTIEWRGRKMRLRGDGTLREI